VHLIDELTPVPIPVPTPVDDPYSRLEAKASAKAVYCPGELKSLPFWHHLVA